MRITPPELPSIVLSDRAPIEYNVEHQTTTVSLPSMVPSLSDVPVLRLPRVVLVDDRGRRFAGFTVQFAFRRAEKAQDPADPIHHPP